MTDKQKSALREIRNWVERTKKLVLDERTKHGIVALGNLNLVAAEKNLETCEKLLDAIEADGKCEYISTQRPFATYECGKCGKTFHGRQPFKEWKHCPGCGREIEAAE